MPEDNVENQSNNFNWNDESAPYSHHYLAPPIIANLKSISANKVLDAGSGNGRLSAELHALGMSMVGTEYDPHGVELAKEAYPDIPFYVMGVQDDPSKIIKKHGKFDAVLSTEVIEHLFDPSQLISFSSKFLETGGHLVISTPYHGYFKNLSLALLNKWDFHFHPWKVGGHIKFWSRNTLSAFLEDNGFAVVKFEGAGRFPFLWKSMILVARKK